MTETDGHGDTCGPIVMLDYVAVTQGKDLSVAAVDALRQTLISHGLMASNGTGMFLTQIAQGLKDLYGVTALRVVEWNTSTVDQFHADLKAAVTAHQAVIYETHNASAFPDGQPGVQNHFILIWGYDDVKGYLCCNGDTMTALHAGGVTAPVFASWGALEATLPSAWMVLPAHEGVPVHTGPDYSTLGAGMAQYVKDHNVTAKLLVGEVELYPGSGTGETVAAFEGNLVLYYHPGISVLDNISGDVVAGLRNALARADTSIASTKATDATEEAAEATEEGTEAAASTATLTKALQTLQAMPMSQLEALVNTIGADLDQVMKTLGG